MFFWGAIIMNWATILYKYICCRSGLQNWHNTLGEEDSTIPIWKDPNLVLNYDTFWSQKDLWKPYIAKPAGDDAIRNYEISLAACTPRIQLLNEERAHEIIGNLQVCEKKLKAS